LLTDNQLKLKEMGIFTDIHNANKMLDNALNEAQRNNDMEALESISDLIDDFMRGAKDLEYELTEMKKRCDYIAKTFPLKNTLTHGRTKNMFMDLQCLIQHIENIEQKKAYNDRRARKSKAFSISKSLKNK